MLTAGVRRGTPRGTGWWVIVARSGTSSERREDSLDLVLEALPRSVSTARHAVRELIERRGGIPAEGVEDVLLLVSELVTNVVLHARTVVRLRVSVQQGRVIVAIGDDDPDNPPQWAERPPLAATSGRGMRLVDLLASSWGVEVQEGSKVVWFETCYPPDLIDLRSG